MGMFDYLVCEMPLPVTWRSADGLYQTKDTDAQYMERYTIKADGRLVHHAVRYEEIPTFERPYPNAKPDSLESIIGSIRSIPVGEVDVPFHGDLEFCDYDDQRGMVRFTARFTEGRCARIWHTWEPPWNAPDAEPPAPS